MGKKSDPPAPPDPQETAAAQTGQNVGTAIANTMMGQVNQTGPDGSLSYDQTGSFQWRDPNSGQSYMIPRFTATTTLSEDAQQLRDAENRGNISLANLGADQADRLGGLLSDPFDPASISPARSDRSGAAPVQYGDSLTAPNLQTDNRALPGLSSGGQQLDLATGYAGADDFGAQRDQIVDGLFGQLNEQRTQDLETYRSDLYNRGIREGTEAYSRAMEDFDRSVDDRRLAAILAGGQEQSRLVGMARDAAGFGNNANQAMWAAGEDQRRYGDSMDMALFGMGSDQLNYNNMVGQNNFQNQAAIQGRQDSIADANYRQQQQIWNDQDRSRAQALDEAYTARINPINEVAALLGHGQVNTPGFSLSQPAQMPTTDIAGITQQGWQNQFSNWNARNQQNQAMMGGLFGLAGAGLAGGVGPSWLYGA